MSIDGRFVLRSKVGSGGMGEVFRGVDLQTGSDVAVKVIKRASAIEKIRFAREVDLLAAVHHRGVVGYVSHGELPSGAPYLVMEWVEGQTLADRMSDDGLTIADTVGVIKLIAQALGAAHQCGVVHRDIKPSNILFADGSLARVVVIDFGIARRAGMGSALTQTGTVVGTLGFMSPEQARGDSKLDARSDVFGLGCLLYMCLCGHSPFPGESLLAVQSKILFDEPAPIVVINPEVPGRLATLVGEMLHKELERRPPDGNSVACRLAEFASVPATTVVRSYVEESTTAARFNADQDDESSNEAVAIIVVSSNAERHGDDDQQLFDIGEQFGGQVYFLSGGGMVAAFMESASVAAVGLTAGRCALAMRRAQPDAQVALAIGAGLGRLSGAFGAAIDRGAQTLRTATMSVLFRDNAASAPAGAVNLDGRSAELLRPYFRVSTIGSIHYLSAVDPVGEGER